MISKYLLVALSLTIGASAAVQNRDLERWLPSPSWVMSHSGDLGLEPGRARQLRLDLQASRRALLAMRDDHRTRRDALQASLSAPQLDRATIEERFESLLELENTMKRQALGSRLDLLEALTGEQRARLREGASRAVGQRAVLRARIEQIRRLGQRIRVTGGEVRPLRDRVRRVERLIRAGELERALDLSDRILDELDR